MSNFSTDNTTLCREQQSARDLQV